MKKLVLTLVLLVSGVTFAKTENYNCMEPINQELFGFQIDIQKQACYAMWIDSGVRIDNPDNQCAVSVERTSGRTLVILPNYVGLRKPLIIDVTNKTVQVGDHGKAKALECEVGTVD